MTSGEQGKPLTAVRPPEYWPAPQMIALADAADRLVLADTLQYSRQSYQNRARLRTPDGWQWISVPLKGGQHGRPISDVEIRHRHAWMGKHWRAMHFNYRRSPYFDYYEPRLRPIFAERWGTLGDLTCRSVGLVADLLGITTPIERASRMEGAPATVPAILEACGTDRLLTGRDTAAIDEAFAPDVRVLSIAPLRYRQNFDGFEAGMSTLDLLFNYGPESLSMIRRAATIEAVAAPT